VIEGLVDISINETTVHNLKNSTYEVQGPYGELVGILEQETGTFYSQTIAGASFDDMVKMFTEDQRLMNRILVAGSLPRFLNIGNRVFVNQMLLTFKDKFTSFAPSAVSLANRLEAARLTPLVES
jgi:hypothetical protein